MEFVVIIIGLMVILVIFGYSRWQIETDISANFVISLNPLSICSG